MLRLFFILKFIFVLSNAYCQIQSSIWQLGTNPSMGSNYPSFGIDFNQGFADTFTVYRPMSIFITDASICDTTGQLLFYTNGVYIANRNHDTILNCNNFNPGYSTDFYDEQGLGHTQAAMAIPKPASATDYFIFHTSAENLVYRNIAGTYPIHLSCSEVNMTADNGLGGLNENFKNVHVVEDTIYKGRITGCKHANGRDWWVVVKEMTSNRYYKILITPDGVSSPIGQSIGPNGYYGNIFGMATFSPDGSKYVHLDMNDTLSYMQFDRCTGEFYNQVTIAVPDSPVTLSATLGCQFSPNSRFLYVNSYRRLWQFDTWADSIQSSMLLIDTTNNFEDKFIQQLAPDGKIYISTFNSNGQHPFLNVINNPDSIGIGCNFEIAGLPLPLTDTNSGIPNFPNYDLGALLGSPCDTLFNSSETPALAFNILDLKILPNLNKGKFTLHYHLLQNKEGIIEIINMQGRIEALFKRPMWSSILNADVNLMPGMYLVRLKSGGSLISKTMVVQ